MFFPKRNCKSFSFAKWFPKSDLRASSVTMKLLQSFIFEKRFSIITEKPCSYRSQKSAWRLHNFSTSVWVSCIGSLENKRTIDNSTFSYRESKSHGSCLSTKKIQYAPHSLWIVFIYLFIYLPIKKNLQFDNWNKNE